jgi:hypothetical protein
VKIKIKEKLFKILSVANKTINGYDTLSIKIKTETKNKTVRK